MISQLILIVYSFTKHQLKIEKKDCKEQKRPCQIAMNKIYLNTDRKKLLYVSRVKGTILYLFKFIPKALVIIPYFKRRKIHLSYFFFTIFFRLFWFLDYKITWRRDFPTFRHTLLGFFNDLNVQMLDQCKFKEYKKNSKT